MRLLLRLGIVALLAGLFLGRHETLAQVGTAFTYQGRLTDGAAPAHGSYDLQLKLWDAASGGAIVGPALTLGNVNVASGLFTVVVDFGAGMFSGSRRWLEIGVATGGSGGPFTALAPRQELTPVANAVFSATTGDPSVQRRTVPPTCPVGHYVRSLAADGTPTCATDADTNSGGTVTSVGAGAGLTGGPVTGAGTLAVATGGIAAGMIANGAVGAAQINTAQVQTRLASTCPIGEYLRGVNADGTVVCGTFAVPPLISTVDDSDTLSPGLHTSIAIGADGLPVISHYEAVSRSLIVAKCANTACAGVSTITTVDASGLAGEFSSLAMGADGFPVISYYSETGTSLKVAKCVNAACTGTSTTTTVDTQGSVGQYTSIAVGADGLPVISYYDSGALRLKVAKCTNAACTGTSTITPVDAPPNDVGKYTALALGTDGFPVISYFDQTARALKVAKCVNAACSGPPSTITTVDDPSNFVGFYTAIAIGSDGFPVISYFDETAKALKVAKCANPACTGASTITTVDDPVNFVGRYTSIAIGADGFPVISYWDQTAAALKVAKCANAACTGVSVITTLDDPANSVGTYTSIAIGADGLPVISYFDATANALKVVKCNKPGCTP